MRWRLALAVFVMFVVLGLAAPAAAGPGTLDRSFGRRGTITTRFGNYHTRACGLAFAPNGKVVAVGGTHNGVAIARYSRNGVPDPTFGQDGKVWHDFTGPSRGTEGACAVVMQTDGKIVVGGGASSGGFVARYRDNGTLDRSFGSDGVARMDDSAMSLTLQPDGKIVVAAYRYVARLLPDGSFDPSFGKDGKSETNIDPEALVLQPDGKIVAGGVVVVGECSGGGCDVYSAIERLNADGTLDRSFSGDGKRTRDENTGCTCAVDVALQVDGKILYRAEGGSTPHFPLFRYLPDGRLDRTFGHDGKVAPRIQGTGIAVQRNGKILLSGFLKDRNFGVLRLKRDGPRDRRFGRDGIARTHFEAAATTITVAIQPSGRIVGGGFAGGSFALARFFPK
jgi:uncharacterized delta-60 repeat protein